MNLAVGIALFWVSMGLLYIAFHKSAALTPWAAIQELTAKVTGAGGDTTAGEQDGVEGEFVDVPGAGE